ncbi:MAG: cadherin-like domain-containing protein, partial [Rubripirellula sp.]
MTKRVARSQQRRVRVRRRLLVERLGDRRVLAAITGAVFDDVNHSFQRDADETAAANRLVFIDANENGTLDASERFALADSDGNFEFADLTDGTYQVRLFNGAGSQTQTLPVSATQDAATIAVADASQLVAPGPFPIALTSGTVVLGDLGTGLSDTVVVGDQLSQAQLLPGGKLLIIGTDASGATAWELDSATQAVSEVNLADSDPPIEWAELAIDGDGRGVILEPTTGTDPEQDLLGIRGLDGSDGSITVSDILTTIPADARVITSDTGNRSVFAWAESDGLQLSLWSNVTSSFITSSKVADTISTELLAFDDASGILAIRTESGGVSVHDADANFAPLHTLQDVTGPIAIDGARDLLITVSPTEAMLKLINLRDGTLVADLAVDLSTIGQVSALAIGESNDAVTLLGAAGMTEIALRKASAREVTIVDNAGADSVLFGISVSGENAAPSFETKPAFTTDEDKAIALLAPAALEGASDANNDEFIVLQRSTTANGSAVVSFDGGFVYSPNADFNGTDSLLVQLHDGRDISEMVALNVTVVATPDPPTDVKIDFAPIA